MKENEAYFGLFYMLNLILSPNIYIYIYSSGWLNLLARYKFAKFENFEKMANQRKKIETLKFWLIR
jgi:hypothetical protein